MEDDMIMFAGAAVISTLLTRMSIQRKVNVADAKVSFVKQQAEFDKKNERMQTVQQRQAAAALHLPSPFPPPHQNNTNNTSNTLPVHHATLRDLSFNEEENDGVPSDGKEEDDASLTTQQLQAIIFDLDGTLLNSHECIEVCISHSVNSFGGNVPPITRADVCKHLGAPFHELYDIFMAPFDEVSSSPSRGSSSSHRRPRLAIFRQRFLDQVELEAASPIFTNVIEGLKEIKRRLPNVKLGIGTTKPTEVALDDLTRNGIHHFFDHIQGTDEGMSAKPAPDVILTCAAALGVDCKHSIYIGDTDRDAVAAKAALCKGCMTIHNGEEEHCKGILGADHLVYSVMQALKCVEDVYHQRLN
jgi:phosphoglycolate phosphatase